MCALNLVDAAEGAGGAFYGRYQRLLPPIHELQLPFTLRGSHLAQVRFRQRDASLVSGECSIHTFVASRAEGVHAARGVRGACVAAAHTSGRGDERRGRRIHTLVASTSSRGNDQLALVRASQLHTPAVEAAAAAQKERLKVLFPQLMPDEEDEEEDGPGLLQWAYACVRSRAFFLGGNYFAYLPFLDMANHSSQPTAAYRPTGRDSPINSRRSRVSSLC